MANWMDEAVEVPVSKGSWMDEAKEVTPSSGIKGGMWNPKTNKMQPIDIGPFVGGTRGLVKGLTDIPFTDKSILPSGIAKEVATEVPGESLTSLGEFAGGSVNPVGVLAGSVAGKTVSKTYDLAKNMPGFKYLDQTAKGFVMRNITNGEKTIQNAGADFLTSAKHGKTETDKLNSLVDFAKKNDIVKSNPKDMSIAADKLVENTGERIGSLIDNVSAEAEKNLDTIPGLLRSRSIEDLGMFKTKPIVNSIVSDVKNITSDPRVIKNVESKLLDLVKEPAVTLKDMWEFRKTLDDSINYKSIKSAMKSGSNISETQQSLLTARTSLQKKITDVIESMSGSKAVEELKQANLDYQKSLGLDMMATLRERAEYMPKIDMKVVKGVLRKIPEYTSRSITSPSTYSNLGKATEIGVRGLTGISEME